MRIYNTNAFRLKGTHPPNPLSHVCERGRVLSRGLSPPDAPFFISFFYVSKVVL
jgi:hypothetical protein